MSATTQPPVSGSAPRGTPPAPATRPPPPPPPHPHGSSGAGRVGAEPNAPARSGAPGDRHGVRQGNAGRRGSHGSSGGRPPPPSRPGHGGRSGGGNHGPGSRPRSVDASGMQRHGGRGGGGGSGSSNRPGGGPRSDNGRSGTAPHDRGGLPGVSGVAPPSADGLAAEAHKTRSNDGRRTGGRGQDSSGGGSGSGSGSGGGGGARARVCVPVSPDHPWRFTAEALRLSPSFRKSVHPSTEAKYRVDGLQFIRRLAGRVFEEELRDKKQLDVAHCTWSAVVYFQRFYTRQSYTAWDRKVVATACVMLAAKVLYVPKAIKKIVQCHFTVLKRGRVDERAALLAKEAIVSAERMILHTLDFDLEVPGPHRAVKVMMRLIGANKKHTTSAYGFLNDSMATQACLKYDTVHIAAASVFWATWLGKFSLPEVEVRNALGMITVMPWRQVLMHREQRVPVDLLKRPDPAMVAAAEAAAAAQASGSGHHPSIPVPPTQYADWKPALHLTAGSRGGEPLEQTTAQHILGVISDLLVKYDNNPSKPENAAKRQTILNKMRVQLSPGRATNGTSAPPHPGAGAGGNNHAPPRAGPPRSGPPSVASSQRSGGGGGGNNGGAQRRAPPPPPGAPHSRNGPGVQGAPVAGQVRDRPDSGDGGGGGGSADAAHGDARPHKRPRIAQPDASAGHGAGPAPSAAPAAAGT